jgi:hypothetical protein
LAAIDGGSLNDVASGDAKRCSRHVAAAGGAVAARIATIARLAGTRMPLTTCGGRIRCALDRGARRGWHDRRS